MVRPEVVYSDVISGVNAELVDVDIRENFGDSTSSLSQDMRLPHLVTDERRTMTTNDIGVSRSSHEGKMPYLR